MGREPVGSEAATTANREPVAHAVPLELGDEGEEGKLSEIVTLDEPPPEIAPPRESKPTHLATSRYRIALLSIALLSFVVVASFADVLLGKSIEDLTRLLDVIFAPIVALVAAAVAFYYYRGSSL